MSDTTKVKIAISVETGYDTVFSHAEMRKVDSFSKEKVVEVLADIANDIKSSITKGRNLEKIQNQNALSAEADIVTAEESAS